nr:MAG TPA: hypothetical protein [Bacteriophage sp.]
MIFYFQARRSNGQRRGRFLGSLMQSSILISTHAAHTRMQNAQLTLRKRRTVFCKIGGAKGYFAIRHMGANSPNGSKKPTMRPKKARLWSCLYRQGRIQELFMIIYIIKPKSVLSAAE